MSWVQVDCALRPAAGVPPAHVPWAALSEVTSEWRDEGRFRRLWFVRKSGVRLRFEADEPAATLEPVLAPWLIGLEHRNELRSFRFAVYEPEQYRFGGPAGMALAHELFDLDTARLLPQLAAGMPADDRARWLVHSTESLLGSAVDDAAEAWDVWCRLQAVTGDLAGDGDAPTLDDDVDVDLGGYVDIGRRLRGCVDAGLLNAGVRQWCADATTFGVNRLGLIFWPGLLRSTIETAMQRARTGA